MAHEPFTRVSLLVDIPEHKLRRGDVATIVENHRGQPGQGPGVTLEFFNALGDTIAVVTLPSSQVTVLHRDEVLHVRHRDAIPA